MKLQVRNQRAIFLFSDNSTFIVEPFTDEDYNFCINHTEEEIKNKFTTIIEMPEVANLDISSSKILTEEEGRIIIPSVSKIGLPEILIKRIIEAEKNGTELKYVNFWKLLSLNPNSHARNNLLWFLEKFDFDILDSGLFVGYRNVVSKNKSELSATLDMFTELVRTGHKESNSLLLALKRQQEYTDQYSRTFSIKLGDVVRMKRSKCDEDSNNPCSRGLHIAHKGWKSLSSFGDTTIACLVNPRNVVSVPTGSDLGKMRVCEYYPMDVVLDNIGDYEQSDELIESQLNYISQLSYEGKVNNNDSQQYKFKRKFQTYQSIKFDLEELKRILNK